MTQALHLHTRTAYSLLKGSMSVETLVLTAKSLGYKQLALTDLNVMYGVPEFLRLCEKHEIKAIVGCELSLKLNGHKAQYTLLAKDYEGYKTLVKVSSFNNANEDVFTALDLKDDSEHIICILHNLGGVFEEAIYNQSSDQILELALSLKSIFKQLYFGASYQEDAYWKKQNQFISELLSPLDIDSVAFSKVYYAKAEDELLSAILVGIEKGINLQEASSLAEKYRYFLDVNEMNALYDQKQL